MSGPLVPLHYLIFLNFPFGAPLAQQKAPETAAGPTGPT